MSSEYITVVHIITKWTFEPFSGMQYARNQTSFLLRFEVVRVEWSGVFHYRGSRGRLGSEIPSCCYDFDFRAPASCAIWPRCSLARCDDHRRQPPNAVMGLPSAADSSEERTHGGEWVKVPPRGGSGRRCNHVSRWRWSRGRWLKREERMTDWSFRSA